MIHNPEAPNSTLGNKTATCRPSGTNSNHLQHTVETRWYSSFLCPLDSDISFSLLGSEVISKNLTRTVLQNWNNDKWQLPPTIIRRIQVVLFGNSSSYWQFDWSSLSRAEMAAAGSHENKVCQL